MSSKNRTLPASERRALETALKLREMGMVPNRLWNACNMGKVTSEHATRGLESPTVYRVKRRATYFEWSLKIDSTRHKLILKVELETEVPLVGDCGPEEVPLYKNIEDLIERWRVESIIIWQEREPLSEGIVADTIFALQAEDFIKFLLADPKSRLNNTVWRMDHS